MTERNESYWCLGVSIIPRASPWEIKGESGEFPQSGPNSFEPIRQALAAALPRQRRVLWAFPSEQDARDEARRRGWLQTPTRVWGNRLQVTRIGGIDVLLPPPGKRAGRGRPQRPGAITIKVYR